MSRVFVTGSSTGLGYASAAALLDGGHRVVVHARDERRAGALGELVGRGADLVVGDLASHADVVSLADQVNRLGVLDALVHNAGIYVDRSRADTIDGHAQVVAVNLLAPYVLTALIARPSRLVYLSSGMHRSGSRSLDDIDWLRRRWNGTQAYCDTKLQLTALALAVARRWPGTWSNAVDPGWVPTRMGGPSAPDDLILGHLTQTWLAAGDDPAADVTGRYWFHQRPEPPAPAALDTDYQDELVDQLTRLTGIELPAP